MPRTGFYNDNEYRAYPLVHAASYAGPALPNSSLLDAGIIMGLDSGYDPAAHSVWLSSITRAGSVISFVFSTDAPGAADKPLQFDRDEDDSEWATSFSQPSPPDGIAPQCEPAPAWEGFIVTGPLSALLEILAVGQTLVFPAGVRTLEPARIQSLMKSYVRSVNVGNTPRTRALPSPDCLEGFSAAANEIVVNATCLSGDVKIKEGYNCRIRQIDSSNEIRVVADAGAGDPNTEELCEHGGELPLYPGEPFDAETGFYGGGPACNQLIATINGVGGANVALAGGTGVRITADAETNTITIARSQTNLLSNCNT
jgi:hypothetical protein